jgi:crotonobetainyl-CoA:carnitine CoA-transferase CaiB-like acyl-CoA transferase/hydroxyacyl-ACP dehydratase HTD2-like protein with hotdog domain
MQDTVNKVNEICSLSMVRRVAAMLDIEPQTFAQGDALPRGWHFFMLSGETPKSNLRGDGFPGFGVAMPDLGLPRLLLGGRTVSYDGQIKIGEAVERTSFVKNIKEKNTASGRMTIVTFQHELRPFSAPNPAIVETQTYILLEAKNAETKMEEQIVTPLESVKEHFQVQMIPDETLLFQYSALGFNSHKIHLDRNYAQNVEGLPDLVVNGGLATLLLTEFLRKTLNLEIADIKVKHIAPLFCNRTMTLAAEKNELGWQLKIYNDCNVVAVEMDLTMAESEPLEDQKDIFEPLKGIKILDLTSVVVGPVATWRLGQYGAEIIKVEHPSGDLMRGLGGISPTGQHSGAYLHFNRGKKNICIDLKQQEGKEICNKLVEQCDVIVANMRPDALERLGLDAASIRAKYPDKIYCLIAGYGTDGPYSGLPTYDSVLQGASGVAGLTMARDGKPKYVPMLLCDHVVGEITAGAVMSALVQRQNTGKGASIEIPMFETMAAFVLQEHLAQQSFYPPVGPAGDLRLLSPHNQPVKTKDGYISFTINTDVQVKAFLKVTERTALLDDARFTTVASRAKYVSEWFEVRGAPLENKTTEAWLVDFRAVDLPAMPCHTLETLPNDPHLKAVGLLGKENHVTEGEIAVIRATIQVDGGYLSARSSAVPCGWDSVEILQTLGYTEPEIEHLIAQKSILGHVEKI